MTIPSSTETIELLPPLNHGGSRFDTPDGEDSIPPNLSFDGSTDALLVIEPSPLGTNAKAVSSSQSLTGGSDAVDTTTRGVRPATGPIDLLIICPAFRCISLSFALAISGDWITETAVLGLLAEADPSALGTGVFFAGMTLPPLLTAPFVGPALDRCNRARAMIASDATAAAITVAFPFIVEMSSGMSSGARVAIIGGLFILRGCVIGVYHSARGALVAGLVSEANLVHVAAVDALAFSGFSSLTAALGGLIYTAVGARWCFAINALIYMFSASLTQCARRLAPHMGSIDSPSGNGKDKETDGGGDGDSNESTTTTGGSGGDGVTFFDGIRYVWMTPVILGTIAVRTTGKLAQGAWDVANVTAARGFGFGTHGSIGIGATMAAFSVGCGVASLLYSRVAASGLVSRFGPPHPENDGEGDNDEDDKGRAEEADATADAIRISGDDVTTRRTVPSPSSARGKWIHMCALRMSIVVQGTAIILLAACVVHLAPYLTVTVLIGIAECLGFLALDALTMGNAKDVFRGRVNTLSVAMRATSYGAGVAFASFSGFRPEIVFLSAGVMSIFVFGVYSIVSRVSSRQTSRTYASV